MTIMRKSMQRIGVVLAFSIAVSPGCSAEKEIGPAGFVAIVQDESEFIGNWSGESICQDRNSPCRDEKNVYHISKSREPGLLTISADKIVDGKPVNMGSIDFKYDKENKTLISESDRAVWKFVVEHRTMEGTLTLMPGKRLFRRISLKKDD